jgi:dihydrofolate reductase
MITGHIFIATSLDGYVARRDGQLDWLMKQKTEGEDHGFETFMASVDGLIIGRGSFETVLAFPEWPYQKPVVVMSQTLTQDHIPENLRQQVRLSRLSPEALMRDLAQSGWKRAYVDGGKIVQSFLSAGLISDILLTRVPILIGDGLPLFGVLDGDIDLQHVATKSFPSGLVSSEYKVLNRNSGTSGV